MRIRRALPVMILAAAGVAALGQSPTPTAPATLPDINAMSLADLLAEFHTDTIKSLPESQRRVDLRNALRHAGPPLIERLRKDLAADPKTARRALHVIAYLGNHARPLVAEIIAVADGKEPDLRPTAISVLCRLRDPRSFDLITRAARDPSPGVRMAVVRDGAPALADARFAVAVTALADPDSSVRHIAINQLKFLNDKRAVAYIAPLLNDETLLHYETRDGVKTAHRIRDNAAHALEYLVNGKYLTDPPKSQEELDARAGQWRAWWKEKGPAFDAALYVEPDIQKALE